MKKHRDEGRGLRRNSGKHSWPVCAKTGKQRLGERKDVKLALEVARHMRAGAELVDVAPTWTVQRGYRCEYCGGWHLTSRSDRLARRAS